MNLESSSYYNTTVLLMKISVPRITMLTITIKHIARKSKNLAQNKQ